jgi:hypothetical protein
MGQSDKEGGRLGDQTGGTNLQLHDDPDGTTRGNKEVPQERRNRSLEGSNLDEAEMDAALASQECLCWIKDRVSTLRIPEGV